MEPVTDLTATAAGPSHIALHRAASSSSDPDFANLDTQGWLDYLLADLPAAAPADPPTAPRAGAAPKSGAGSVAFSLFSEGWDDNSQNFMINAALGEQLDKLCL